MSFRSHDLSNSYIISSSSLHRHSDILILDKNYFLL